MPRSLFSMVWSLFFSVVCLLESEACCEEALWQHLFSWATVGSYSFGCDPLWDGRSSFLGAGFNFRSSAHCLAIVSYYNLLWQNVRFHEQRVSLCWPCTVSVGFRWHGNSSIPYSVSQSILKSCYHFFFFYPNISRWQRHRASSLSLGYIDLPTLYYNNQLQRAALLQTT